MKISHDLRFFSKSDAQLEFERDQQLYFAQHKQFKETVVIKGTRDMNKIKFVLPSSAQAGTLLRNVRIVRDECGRSIENWELRCSHRSIDRFADCIVPQLQTLYDIEDTSVLPFHMLSYDGFFLPACEGQDIQAILFTDEQTTAASAATVHISVDVYTVVSHYEPVERLYMINNLEHLWPGLPKDLKQKVNRFIAPVPDTAARRYQLLAGSTVQHVVSFNFQKMRCHFTLSHPTRYLLIDLGDLIPLGFHWELNRIMDKNVSFGKLHDKWLLCLTEDKRLLNCSSYCRQCFLNHTHIDYAVLHIDFGESKREMRPVDITVHTVCARIFVYTNVH